MRLLIIAIVALPCIVLAQAAPPIDPTAVDGLVSSVTGGYATFGWRGGLAGGLVGLVAVFRLFFPRVWAGWSQTLRLGLVFIFAGVGAGLLAYFGGVAIPAAVGTGMLTGWTAIGVSQTWKATKKDVPKMVKAASQSLKIALKSKHDDPESYG